MRKLVTYNKSQYKALIDQLGVDGFKLMSLLELHGSDQISELLSEKKLVVDVSSFMGLLSGDLQLASKFELLVHQLPFGTLFIGDDKNRERRSIPIENHVRRHNRLRHRGR